MSYVVPVAGATAAVRVPVIPGITGPVADPVRTLTVPEGAEEVPVTRKSPAFHFAVPIVTRSVTAVTSTGAVCTDSGPAAVPLSAVTVKVYLPAARLLMVAGD